MSDLNDDNNSTRGVRQAELVRRAARAELAENVRCTIPAAVDSVELNTDNTIKSVSCKILVQDFHRDETGALVVAGVPIVPSVPVVFLTAGDFTFTCPVRRGTTGTLSFSDRSLDRWLSGDGSEVDPELYVRHALADAIFTPGLLPFGISAKAPSDHATAGSIDGKRIHFRSGTITLGDEGSSDFLALAQKCLANDTAIWDLLNGVFGAMSTPLVTPAPTAPDPVYAAMKAAIAAAILAMTLPPASVAATVGKAE